MEHQILWTIKTTIARAFPSCKLSMPWSRICEDVEKLKPISRSIFVTWEKSGSGEVKINTDGSFSKESGKAGIGGIVRNEHGDFIFAFAILVQCKDHNCAEALAVHYGGIWCISNGYNRCAMVHF